MKVISFLTLAALLPTLVLAGEPTPKAQTKTSPPVSAKRQEELAKTAAKRREAKFKKSAQRQNRAYLERESRIPAQKEAERLAPLLLQQQMVNSTAAYQAATANALNQMGQAAQYRAVTDRKRYILQSQEAGQPQIFDRSSGGFVPYGGGVARPYPR